MRDIPLNENGKSVEGTLEGEFTMVVRRFNYRGALCLNVEIDVNTASQLYHDRSDALLEVLPGGGGYGASGDYCDFEQTADGVLFSLTPGNDQDYGEILVTSQEPAARAG